MPTAEQRTTDEVVEQLRQLPGWDDGLEGDLRPALDSLLIHSPPDWPDPSASEEDLENLLYALAGLEPLWMIILAADIRKSTHLIKEAIDQRFWADTLTALFKGAREVVHNYDGFYDKFTGDGFLAYWPCDMGDIVDGEPVGRGHVIVDTVLSKVVPVCEEVMNLFTQGAMPDFRANTQNFPPEVGLSIGVDAGPCRWIRIVSETTITGPAIVGAVRMEQAAGPGETLVNSTVGFRLQHPMHEEKVAESRIQVVRELRAPKDSEHEVYRMTLPRQIPPDHSISEMN